MVNKKYQREFKQMIFALFTVLVVSLLCLSYGDKGNGYAGLMVSAFIALMIGFAWFSVRKNIPSDVTDLVEKAAKELKRQYEEDEPGMSWYTEQRDKDGRLEWIAVEGNPYPVVLLGSPARYVPLSVIQTIADPCEHELLEKSKEVLAAFAEGVEWSDDQRKAYTNLHTAVHRFKPNLSRFQNN